MNNSGKKVLVTGASGYIALHCISELIKSGYKVKGSLRNLNKEIEVRKALGSLINDSNFEICKLNLLSDEGWDSAASDCEFLLHIASPCIIKEPKIENEIIKPAVEGTIRALTAAQNSNIKKVVLTSSIGSIAYGHDKKICNNKDWTNIRKGVGSYIKSKTMAEKAAWDFLNNLSNPSFSMTSIHPGMVFGPLLNNNIEGASANLIKQLIKGEFPALPNIYFTVVDVRDVAELHVKSLINRNSDNKRIIVTSQKSISFSQISMQLRQFGFLKSPLNLIPSSLIKFLAIFNKDMKTTLSMINRGYFEVEIYETKSIFNWEPIAFDKTMRDMTTSLQELLN